MIKSFKQSLQEDDEELKRKYDLKLYTVKP